jgi:hypothetical protein
MESIIFSIVIIGIILFIIIAMAFNRGYKQGYKEAEIDIFSNYVEDYEKGEFESLQDELKYNEIMLENEKNISEYWRKRDLESELYTQEKIENTEGEEIKLQFIENLKDERESHFKSQQRYLDSIQKYENKIKELQERLKNKVVEESEEYDEEFIRKISYREFLEQGFKRTRYFSSKDGKEYEDIMKFIES